MPVILEKLMKQALISKSEEQTIALAQSIGEKLKGGETIELISDLGGGKTTFVKGLAKGINSADLVASPSFTISRVYQGKKLKINHYDFYRLVDPGVVGYQLVESENDPKTVTVVEWSDVVANALPKDRLQIIIKAVSDNNREIGIKYPETLKYLMKNI